MNGQNKRSNLIAKVNSIFGMNAKEQAKKNIADVSDFVKEWEPWTYVDTDSIYSTDEESFGGLISDE